MTRPGQWVDYVSFLISGRDEVNGWLPLWLRLPTAAALIVLAAKTDRAGPCWWRCFLPSHTSGLPRLEDSSHLRGREFHMNVTRLGT